MNPMPQMHTLMSSHKSSDKHFKHPKKLAPVNSGMSQLSGMGSPIGFGGPNSSGMVIGEESTMSDNMAKIKQEFVEYVKEILTKTTSQVGAQSQGGGAQKQKAQKLSQMNMIEEVTYFLKEGRENRQRVINNISIPELMKNTSKKEAAQMLANL